MTEGSILRLLIGFALPLMLGNVFQMLYNTVDSVIVGNFVSKQALAAIGSTTMIVNMMVFRRRRRGNQPVFRCREHKRSS